MQKSKINARYRVAVSLALCCSGAEAQSSVTLFGMTDAFVGSSRPAGGAGRAWIVNSGGMQTSYWGMRGTEDLGQGVKAFFDVSGFVRVDSGKFGRHDADGMLTRSAFVGLDSASYGVVRLGRNATPYMISTILFNPLVDSFVFSPAVVQTYFSTTNGRMYDPGVIGDNSWSNSVVYSMPKRGGFTANVIYGFGEQPGRNSANKWGGNVLYLDENLGATLAFQQIRFNSTPGDVIAPQQVAGFSKQTALTGGVSYDFRFAKFFLQGQYIRTSVDNATGDIARSAGQVGTSVPVGRGKVLVSYAYAYAKTRNDAMDMRRNTAAIAYDYYLSNRTDVYAAYFIDKLSDRSRAEIFGAGIRHRF